MSTPNAQPEAAARPGRPVPERIGKYEIIKDVGRGSTGYVYLSHDPYYGRDVAIKVLPEHIASREDLRARFEREARAIASLNHPSICSLFDIGSGYMVMELIDGETVFLETVRYRTVGDMSCTGGVRSQAVQGVKPCTAPSITMKSLSGLAAMS